MTNELEIPNEFFDQEQQSQPLCQTMPKAKKLGGAYPLHEKKKRRDEVFRLHFDYGYSARKIADMMKVSRNTVNSDISYCYCNLQKQDDLMTHEDWINKILYRFETSRSKIAEKMEKTTIDHHEWLSLQKMLSDIDNKTIQVIIKMQESSVTRFDVAISLVNEMLAGQGHTERYHMWGDLLKTSPQTSRKITDLIKSDRRIHKS